MIDTLDCWIHSSQLPQFLNLTLEQLDVVIRNEREFPVAVCTAYGFMRSRSAVEDWHSRWTREDLLEFIDLFKT
jgi:hypothetical protein